MSCRATSCSHTKCLLFEVALNNRHREATASRSIVHSSVDHVREDAIVPAEVMDVEQRILAPMLEPSMAELVWPPLLGCSRRRTDSARIKADMHSIFFSRSTTERICKHCFYRGSTLEACLVRAVTDHCYANVNPTRLGGAAEPRALCLCLKKMLCLTLVRAAVRVSALPIFYPSTASAFRHLVSSESALSSFLTTPSFALL